jgi:hypothetical protein
MFSRTLRYPNEWQAQCIGLLKKAEKKKYDYGSRFEV